MVTRLCKQVNVEAVSLHFRVTIMFLFFEKSFVLICFLIDIDECFVDFLTIVLLRDKLLTTVDCRPMKGRKRCNLIWRKKT